MLVTANELFEREREALRSDYLAFLRFKSISADPAYRSDMIACCNWVADYLKRDFSVEVWETPGYPLVYAEYLEAGPDKPTLLLYGHYDVQPVDPIEEWESDPFEPRIEGEEVYARGAQDNKGQIIYALAALRALKRRDGKLPVNLKICVEGEEESKSVGLSKILAEKASRLKADYLVSPDFDVAALDKPTVTLGLRGMVAITVELIGSTTDLHSGMAGGIVLNPNHVLIEMLAALRKSDGSISVPGFYDRVAPISDRESLDLSIDEGFFKEIGAAMTGGESDFSPGESGKARPTLEINGFTGGYGGPGFKTVIPAKATAKISCRLVPDQDHNEIREAIVAFLKERCPEGMELRVTDHGGAVALRTGGGGPLAQAMAEAYEEVFGHPCSYSLSGGSVPISAELAKAAGADAIFMGVGLIDDRIHAPNEHFGFDRQRLGFLTIARFVEILDGVVIRPS